MRRRLHASSQAARCVLDLLQRSERAWLLYYSAVALVVVELEQQVAWEPYHAPFVSFLRVALMILPRNTVGAIAAGVYFDGLQTSVGHTVRPLSELVLLLSRWCGNPLLRLFLCCRRHAFVGVRLISPLAVLHFLRLYLILMAYPNRGVVWWQVADVGNKDQSITKLGKPKSFYLPGPPNWLTSAYLAYYLMANQIARISSAINASRHFTLKFRIFGCLMSENI